MRQLARRDRLLTVTTAMHNPPGGRTAAGKGFTLPMLTRRQGEALVALCLLVLSLLIMRPATASVFIDDPALLGSSQGLAQSNGDVVALLPRITLLHLDPDSTRRLVQPVTLDNGNVTLPGPVDARGKPLMGSVNNPTATDLPLANVGNDAEYPYGEAIFFRARHPSGANDALAQETLTLRVRVVLRDRIIDEEFITLTETSADSGIYLGYVQHTSNKARPGDFRFTLPEGATVEFVDVADTVDTTLEAAVTATIVSAAIPVDVLFLTKQAMRDTVSVGDFLQYQVGIENIAGIPVKGVRVTDVLPVGFRYRAGSASLNGGLLADPTIDPDGHTLHFALGRLGADANAQLRYVVEVTAASRTGKVQNLARARASLGAPSNTASATVKVTEDLFRSTSILVGRVAVDSCNATVEAPAEGLRNVRLYTENGTTVLTDEHGRFHIAGLAPGTHVLQLDPDSIPDEYEIVPCNENTRFAGRTWSQFVDLQGGSLWRADFNLRRRGPMEQEIGQSLSARVINDHVLYTVEAYGGSMPLDDAFVALRLGAGLVADLDSFTIDDESVQPVVDPDGTLRVPLGERYEPWSARIDFDAYPSTTVSSAAISTYAWVAFDSPQTTRSESPVSSLPVDIEYARVTLPEQDDKTTEQGLSAGERATLDAMAEYLKRVHDATITVVAHTDQLHQEETNDQPADDGQDRSELRASQMAAYLREKLQLDEDRVIARGEGVRNPVARRSRGVDTPGDQHVEVFVNGGFDKRILFSPDNADASLERTARAGFQLIGSGKMLDAETTEDGRRTSPGFANFRQGQTVPQRIQAVTFVMDGRLSPRLLVDGVEVPRERIGFTAADRVSGLTTYSYIGVDLGERGAHVLSIEGSDTFGNKRYEESITVQRTGDIREIRVVDASGNVADGQTPVRVRIDVLDEDLNPIVGSVQLQLLEGDLQPLRIQAPANILDRPGTMIERDNNGFLRFEPVTQSGRHRVRISWGEDRYKDINIFVAPKFRDWILVGVAEGSAAWRTLSGNMQALPPDLQDEGFDSNGRTAFFARGRVKGDTLLTVAYDTAAASDGMRDDVDPNAWYTVYGDNSQYAEDAPTSSKLYVKVERNQFTALFGDFDTGFTLTELARYQRRLNGLKVDYWDDRLDITAFASESPRVYRRDELRGDGTSGLYSLSRRDIVLQSETVRIEVRDRFRNDIVLEERPLTRYLDYSFDADSGAIWFKEPIPSQDDRLNPVFIVVDYEIDGGVDDFTAGTRAVLRQSDRLEVGVTLVEEGLGTGSANMTAADATFQLDSENRITAELAATDSSASGPTTTSGGGDAWLLRHNHDSGKLSAETWARGTGGGYGLGQLSAAEEDTRSLGTQLRYNLRDHVTLNGQLSRDEQTDLDRSRDMLEARANIDIEDRGWYAGTRLVRDDYGSASPARGSDQLIGGGHRDLPDGRTRLRVDGETNIAPDPDSVDYPHRIAAGADYRLDARTTLFATQEFAFGSDRDSQGTRGGVRYTPWSGGQLSTSATRETNEFGERVYANAGLVQNWIINGSWTADAGLDRVETISDTGYLPFDPDLPGTNGGTSEDFTALFAGVGFSDGQWRWRGRVETRFADSEDKLNLLTGLYRELNNADTLAGTLRHTQSDRDNGDSSAESVLGLGFAHRPLGARWILLNQTDLVLDSLHTGTQSMDGQRLVNNFNANWQARPTDQLSLQYGAKFVFDTIDAQRYSGYTDLMGIEWRHDLTAQWDAGFRASLLHSWSAGVVDESYGPFVGWTPVTNVWLTLGFNIKGFRDDDFAGAGYRDTGLNFGFRIKLDQETTREVSERFRSNSPGNAGEPIDGSGPDGSAMLLDQCQICQEG